MYENGPPATRGQAEHRWRQGHLSATAGHAASRRVEDDGCGGQISNNNYEQNRGVIEWNASSGCSLSSKESNGVCSGTRMACSFQRNGGCINGNDKCNDRNIRRRIG